MEGGATLRRPELKIPLISPDETPSLAADRGGLEVGHHHLHFIERTTEIAKLRKKYDI